MSEPAVSVFQAVADLCGGCIDISWNVAWPRLAERPRFRLRRRRRAYSTTVTEGVEVADTAGADQVVVDEALDPDRDERRARFTVRDRDLDGGVVYYYALFVQVSDSPEVFRGHRAWRAAVTATGIHGFGRRLYELLPGIHQRLDEPEAGAHGPGPLRRFLSVPGAALDQVRSLAEALGDRHDVLHVRADLLSHLARWIGWELDRTLDAMAQRQEILFAPELFKTVGTAPNLRAQVNRLTGWDCRVKDMVHNVFRSNAPERVRLWEIWSAEWDGETCDNLRGRTRTDGFDGRPAAVATGEGWLFWHRDLGGRREIRVRSLAEGGSSYRAALDDAEPPGARLAGSDEEPTAVADGDRIWLFWTSNRGGAWDVWGAWDAAEGGIRPFEQPPQGVPENLTAHPGSDLAPVAVRDGERNKIWLFWQSDRRGPTDIWRRVYDPQGGGWEEEPQRVTRAERRHEMPAAAIDDEGRIWLVFCDDLGDRRNLAVVVGDGETWSEPRAINSRRQRDESPCAVFWDDRMWIYWHSNRSGTWQILGQPWSWADGGAEALGEPIAVTSGPAADQEPAAVADGAGLRLFWRSQRRGFEYRSRTVDFDDEEMVARIRARSFDDRAHYTFEPAGVYARDAVGVYITAGTENQGVIERQKARVQAVLARELPVNVRAILIVEPASYVAETHSGLLDSHLDRMLGWTWFHSWQEETYEDHLTVDFDQHPVSTRYRTWHVGELNGDG